MLYLQSIRQVNTVLITNTTLDPTARTKSSAMLSTPDRLGSGATAAMDAATPTPATEWTAAMHTSSDVLSENTVGERKCSAILQLGHCSQNASAVYPTLLSG